MISLKNWVHKFELILEFGVCPLKDIEEPSAPLIKVVWC